MLKKEIKYLLITILLFGSKCAEELHRAPFNYVVTIQTGNKNTSNGYLSVYTVKKNDTDLSNQLIRFRLSSDSSYFPIPPDYNTDSIYLCFENINLNIDTVGLCYKRKLFIRREYTKQAFDMDVYDSKIFYLSNRFDKDSSIIYKENNSNQYEITKLRIYKK